jgi:predicted PurR-regulated permease PerM
MNAKDSVKMDLTRTLFAILFIGTLMAACSWILLPFLNAFLWATTLVVTTWPLMLGLQTRLGGKRGLAVTLATILLLLVVIIPLLLAVTVIIVKLDEFTVLSKSLASFTMPPPPDWIRGIPLAGAKISDTWMQYATLPPDEFSVRLTPYAEKVLKWFSTRAGTGLMMFSQFILTVIISAILYANGEKAAHGFRLFARRLAGQQGDDMVTLSGKTVRSVALGIVVTALIQTSIGGIGLIIAGVPAPGLLMAVMFMFGLAQVGSSPVLIPAVIWVYSKEGAMWGTILLAVSLVSILCDNVIRPFLIKKGADLPLIMIFAGVIGGLIAFGILGLFIGPIILAVSYTLLESWVLGRGRQIEVGEGEGIG